LHCISFGNKEGPEKLTEKVKILVALERWKSVDRSLLMRM